jgi:hypothetical protein
MMDRYRRHLDARGLAAKTIERYIATVRLFGDFTDGGAGVADEDVDAGRLGVEVGARRGAVGAGLAAGHLDAVDPGGPAPPVGDTEAAGERPDDGAHGHGAHCRITVRGHRVVRRAVRQPLGAAPPAGRCS